MATNNMASDAFKRAQNLLSPGYNKIDTFEAVTTLSKDDAQDLARAMKLDAGVTGYGNTPFKDNQASMDSYFPSINEPEAAVTNAFVEDSDVMTYPKDLQQRYDELQYLGSQGSLSREEKEEFIMLRSQLSPNSKPSYNPNSTFGEAAIPYLPFGEINKGVDWLGDKYNEILNGLSKASPIQSANAGTKENFLGSTDSIYDATDYMDFLKDKEYFKAEAYDPTAKKGQLRGKEKHLTIGYGHNGPDVQEGVNLTERQASNILRNDIEIRLKEITKAIPKFESLPKEARQNLLGSWFRGSIKPNHKTVKLINKGKYKEASKEFLKHDEYLKYKREGGMDGVVKRMEATAQALRNLK